MAKRDTVSNFETGVTPLNLFEDSFSFLSDTFHMYNILNDRNCDINCGIIHENELLEFIALKLRIAEDFSVVGGTFSNY